MSTKRRRPVQAKRRMNVKNILVMAACMALVAVVSVGGTLAWLQASTGTITNTFSPSNITLSLTETGSTNGNKSYQLVPGVDLSKDPKVNASSDVPYYVFVKVTESNWPTFENTDGTKKVSYTIATGWTELTGVTLENGEKVYYKTMAANEALTDESILSNNTVTVSNTLTESELATLKDTNVSLAFTAYAIQQQNGTGTFEPAAAWNLAKAQQ